MRSLLTAALLLLAGCGHVVPGSLTGTGQPFDFKELDCHAYLDTDSAKVEVRYLGSGGLFVRWRDEAILVGPQFSNPGYVRVLLRNAAFDEPRIRSNRSARQFLTIVKDLVPGGGAPANDVCGVKTARYTMAVPGSSLLFEPRVMNEK
jgi:hypothetical protein